MLSTQKEKVTLGKVLKKVRGSEGGTRPVKAQVHEPALEGPGLEGYGLEGHGLEGHRLEGHGP